MTDLDRAKVIKGLEVCLAADLSEGENPCAPCPYFFDGMCQNTMKKDALALLREQDTVEHALDVLKAHGWKDSSEAVKPKPTGVEPNYNCGNCRMPIQQGYPFCPWCGRKVKWDAD